MKEMINHPEHYNKEGRPECIVEMMNIFGVENTLIWAIMTAYKYQYRKGDKDDIEQEEGKIKWYEDWVEKHNNGDYRVKLILDAYKEKTK